jgi:NADPH-dependent 2,4-dienoyl-CoA reductase/sulfur reductase-like enzyme
MQRVLGADAASLLAEVLAEAGVEYRGGRTVTGLEAKGDRVLVEFGEHSVCADTVVVGIGTVPQVAWLGVEGTGGVECDEQGRAVVIPNAFAVGDAAAWPDPHSGECMRVEHWTSARTQAAVVSAEIAGVGSTVPAAEPGYFWTDQFGLKIQVVGQSGQSDRTVLVRPAGGGIRRSVVLYLRRDTVVGCCLFSAARLLGPLTALIRNGADAASALAAVAP